MLTLIKEIAAKSLQGNPRLFDMARRALRSIDSGTSPVRVRLAEFVRSRDEVTFIQIGANDGMTLDPLREFVVADERWRGAFVEPMEDLFLRLRRNYSYLKGRRLSFFNVAVSDTDGVKQFWRLRNAHQHPFASLVGSFDRSHVVKHLPDLEDQIESVPVACKTYAAIVKESGLSRIDILHLDVEGHEQSILSSIDYQTSGPSLILFEIAHMGEEAKAATYALLRGHGYEIEQLGLDCLATILRSN